MALKRTHKLTAIFNINLPFQIILCRPENDNLIYHISIDDFDIELNLVKEEGWSTIFANDTNPTFGVNKVSIFVSRFETVEPPQINIFPEGGRDLSLRASYFKERELAYKKVAVEIIERPLLYFKYSLQQSNLSMTLTKQDFENPHWKDEAGSDLETGRISFISMAYIRPRLSEKSFTPDEDDLLRSALGNRLSPSLHQELLSDAQNAYYEGNIRRAILELAISCEILVKQFFYANNPIASSTFDYIEEKSSTPINVLDLLNHVAKRAFGSSFKDINKGDDYKKIDHLFRCRNKIAHRGETIYRDDKGTTHNVTNNEFIQWWTSLEVLKKWLDSLHLVI
jgi:hypothetical protein